MERCDDFAPGSSTLRCTLGDGHFGTCQSLDVDGSVIAEWPQ